ncbi:DUF11 domain-containing protein [Planosporangium mesophilum]|uniref:DUF11 domain-containing protein n=1 Tax=Planosporangium mesophilum TaxID=689768 RepID=A0A8J3X1M0_9ACTN|nr:DUF11 domain-containing protein [Planosporangium mesophilum]NJC84364.1 hypothetical protein [Planosporangium mesophilum]GII23494.1 hypothetical protein Pme01_30910 [Planosporangium mesophilum]
MWITRAVPVVGVAVTLSGGALSGPAVTATPSPSAPPPSAGAPAGDVAPVLTSTPFASPPGQAVTHTITLSTTGTGTASAVRVTFTTTVELDSVTATPSQGSCPVVTALTVVCDLGNVDFSDASPPTAKVTVAGIVHAGAARGTLVQNLANVTLGAPDADPTNNVVSNAYLAAQSSAAPIPAPSSASPSPQPSAGATRRLLPWATGAAVLVLGAAATALLVRWRRRRS